MRSRAPKAALALAIALFVAAPALQAAPLDLLFATPHLAELPEGATVRYEHVRRTAPSVIPDITETVTLEKRAATASALTLDAGGRPRIVEFDALDGNPVLMVFLESAVRSVAQATGGSPFYLRNRVKEALREDLAEEDGALVARPFAADANRDRLGAFADLTLTFRMTSEAPGMIEVLRAEAPGGAYVEEIRRDPTP